MMTKRHRIFIAAVVFLFLAACVKPVAAEEAVFAVRKAYNDATGKTWEDASDEEKEKFLTKFDRQEENRFTKERLRKQRAQKQEARKARKIEMDRRKIELLERNRERKKLDEQRKIEREKQARERKMQQMKQKIIQQRNKAR